MNAETWFFCFRSEIPFLTKFVPKIKILTVSRNLVPTLIQIWKSPGDIHLFCFWGEIPFWGIFGPKIKIVSLCWNLLEFVEVKGDVYFLCFYSNISWVNLFQKITIFSLPRNLVFRLIWIFRINGVVYFFLFLTGNTLFGEIWSRKLKIVSLSWNVIWCLENSNRQNLILVYFSQFPLTPILSHQYSFPIIHQYSFCANLFQKLKIVSWSWNLYLD